MTAKPDAYMKTGLNSESPEALLVTLIMASAPSYLWTIVIVAKLSTFDFSPHTNMSFLSIGFLFYYHYAQNLSKVIIVTM